MGKISHLIDSESNLLHISNRLWRWKCIIKFCLITQADLFKSHLKNEVTYQSYVILLLRRKWSDRTRLTHRGRETHICVSELTIIGSDNGLSPGRRQAIIWNNAGLLLIEPLGTNFGEISIEIQTFSFKKIHLNMSSAKWRPFCLGLNVLKLQFLMTSWHQRNNTHWRCMRVTVKHLVQDAPNLETWMSLVSPCNCLCQVPWSYVLNRG